MKAPFTVAGLLLLVLPVAGCPSTSVVGDAADGTPDAIAEIADAESTDGEARDVPPADGSPGDAFADDAPAGDALADAPDAGPCPADMALWNGVCIDLYEAPDHAGELPLVMYTFVDADAWCAARGKRLCFDDEWQAACEGPAADAYPYGAAYVPGECNDDKTWRAYDQDLLNGWPWTGASSPDVESLADLLAAARAYSTAGAAAADHVESLYQADPAGSNAGCVGPAGVFDLVGNVEEWTRRRDGGETSFHGALKGRYWAESRTCQGAVTVHGDTFRFYEIGFRCCRDPG